MVRQLVEQVSQPPSQQHARPPTLASSPTRLDVSVVKGASVVVLDAIMSILGGAVVSVVLPTFQTVFETLRLSCGP